MWEVLCIGNSGSPNLCPCVSMPASSKLIIASCCLLADVEYGLDPLGEVDLMLSFTTWGALSKPSSSRFNTWAIQDEQDGYMARWTAHNVLLV